jgi:methyl-accepting chemotaxis protein
MINWYCKEIRFTRPVKEENKMAENKVKAKRITEVKEEQGVNFWADKTACFKLCNCPEMITNECPVSKYQFLPCWEIEGTYCKLDDKGSTGRDTSICETCRVYKKYGNGEPIVLKLFGKGIDTHLRELDKIAK